MCKKSKRKQIKNVKMPIIINALCRTCEFTCKDCKTVNDGKCNNYKKAISIEEMNSYADPKFIDYVCRKYELNKSLMKAMLKEKIPMKHSYYYAISSLILEKDEYLEYIDKFEEAINV